jgi:hypothetical protein
MDCHLLKTRAGVRQNPHFSTIAIKNWSLPHWFVKQSNPLSPGYVFDCCRFVNLCHRNWTAFYDENGEETLAVDEEGTISFSKLGVSVEIWVNNGNTFFRPGRFLRIEQKAVSNFLCIKTKNFYQNGFFESRIFRMDGINGISMGMEIEFHAKGEHAFGELLLLLVIRPFDHNGLAPINRLEYKNLHLRVNNKELIQFETEPNIVFCTRGGAGDITEYFKLGQNNDVVSSPAGNCTGMIGYLVRPADERVNRVGLKIGPAKLFSNQEVYFSKGWLDENEQKWINRFFHQHRMIKTDLKIDYLYRTNINYLVMFSSDFNEGINVYRILALNRLGFYEKSRAFLITALKKVRWDGSLSSVKGLTPETLVCALKDYYRFSGDQQIIKDYWQVLKRIGFWLIQNKNLDPTNLDPKRDWDLGWTCAALNGLSTTSEICGAFEDGRFFREHFQKLWADILSFFSHRVKGNLQEGFRKGLSVSKIMDCLCLSYPLGLYPSNERFIEELILQVKTSTYHGGVLSPLEFQGVDLGLTAKLGSVLLREGLRYEPIFKFLSEAVSPTGSWPDRVHPVLKGGIGATGHSPEVCCHFLLLLRNMMVMEEEGILHLLPGILPGFIWHYPNIELRRLPTFFGEISLRCRSLGNIIQIDFSADFRIKPQQIRLKLSTYDRLLYSDAVICQTGKWVALGPDFKMARLRRR